ncbi:MAG: cobalamin biosynthesis protein CobW [Rickettsiales bacterium]|jgi:cobalamin biosynthesis protein CobW
MKKITKIPTTIVTGFLGAGKTSLIKHVMENAGNRRIALLINEFGDVGVDGEILKSCSSENCPEDSIIELPNGCICCTVADDFLPAMEKILAMEGRFDHIIIETSGLALPKPLVKAFDWPEIRSRLTVDGVIAVVDTPAVFAGDFAENLEAIESQKAEMGLLEHDNPLAEVYEDQLLCADMIILNKTDQISVEELAKVRADIEREINRGVPIIEAAHGRISPDILLGIEAAAEDDVANRISHHENEEEHDHDDFESFVLELPEFIDVQTLHDKIIAVAEQHGVLRVKGYVRIAGKPLRYLVQAVGRRVSGHFDGKPCEVAGNVVIIGRNGLDVAAITKTLVG